jgi:predicted aspartyl protease
MWTAETGNGAHPRLKRYCVPIVVAMLCLLLASMAVAQSPRDLLRKAASQLAPADAPLYLQGTLQVFYPMSNTGTIALTGDGYRFHALIQVGGLSNEFASDVSSGQGWRRQHGLVLPLEHFERSSGLWVSPHRLSEVMRRGAEGDYGVIDAGIATLPDGREARWLRVVPPRGTAMDIYCDADGTLSAWGYHESDGFRRQPTRFVFLPLEWQSTEWGRLPTHLKGYENDRHTQTIRWERIERVEPNVLLQKVHPPSSPPPPAGLPVTLPVRLFQRLILVEAKLNGQEYVMMLDTGAAITVVDTPVAEALRLAPGESINVLGASGQGAATVTRLASLQIGRVTLKDLPVAVLDLGLIRLIGGSRFGGILGFNVLNRFRLTVDYHAQQITLEPSGGKLPPGQAITVSFMGATPMLEMEVEDIGKVPMLLDTGAAMTIVPVEAAQQWQPWRSASLGLTVGVGGAGGTTRAARARTVRLAGETLSSVTLMFSSPAPQGAPVQILSEAGFGLLGNNILRHFRLTIDYPMHTVVLQRMPRPAPMGDLASTGIVLDLTADTAKVAGVTPLSPAWEAGIERGDQVLAVDGRVTRGVSPSEVQKWLTGEEGTVKRLRLQRGAKRWEVRLPCQPMF